MARKYVLNALLAIVFTLLIIFICTNQKAMSGAEAQGNRTEQMEYWNSEADWRLELAFSTILEKGSRNFLAGYAVDETFLSWLASHYGGEAVMDIASYLSEGGDDPETWYRITGNSMHVLWMEYCKDLQYSTWMYSNVIWQECSNPDATVFDFIGDINFDENWYTTQAMNTREGRIEDCISPEIQTELQSADVTLVNNEFTYSSRGKPLEGKAYTFRADPERVGQLSVFGADIVSLANNHVYDYGEDSLIDTMETLKNAGIPYVGAGADLEEVQEISYFIVNGRKVAIIAATQIEKFYNYTREAGDNTPGVLKTLDPALVDSLITKASQISDYVVVYVHWGAEGVLYSQDDIRELAVGYVQAGADVIIGNHSHRLQGLEYIDGVPVFYSLGNFWFCTGTLYTTIVQMRIDSSGALSFAVLPCLQQDLSTRMLTEEQEKQDFYQYLADLSVNAAFRADGFLVEQTGDFTTEDGTGLSWYLPGSHYGERTGAYDLEGIRIDIIGNREY